jgi:hypothetical protein
MATKVPSVEDLKRPTLEYLQKGLNNSDKMREALSKQFNLGRDEINAEVKNQMSTFVNNHAWALVRLQHNGFIRKVGDRTYEITDKGLAYLEGREEVKYPVQQPIPGNMPSWAKVLINRANQKNRRKGATPFTPFTEQDMMVLWQRCEGHCIVTGLEFSEEQVGSGQAKRAFAPSLDRIDPNGFYSVDNCRLMMTAVNFGINVWGLEVYLKLAKEATDKARK